MKNDLRGRNSSEDEVKNPIFVYFVGIQRNNFFKRHTQVDETYRLLEQVFINKLSYDYLRHQLLL